MEHENELIEILKQNRFLMNILDDVSTLDLPNWYLAAGGIFQNVWNALDGKPAGYGLHDIDLVFFDAEHVDQKFDETLEKKLAAKFQLEFDVHNEAGMHLKNGRSQPYESCEDAIANWIATAHCVGITGTSSAIKVYAPYGLADIFSKTVRPTYSPEISRQKYEEKAAKWQARFDGLTIIPFQSAAE